MKRDGKAIALYLALAVFLVSSTKSLAQTVTRGPYIQQGSDTSVMLKWRTSLPTQSVVRYGADVNALNQAASSTEMTTEHEVLLSNLSADTKYYYSIGHFFGPLAGDSTYFFRTSPAPGTLAPIRFWVIGDSGTANVNARKVRDAYKKRYAGSDRAHFMIMLGDNAYKNGTDTEYQAAVFDIYPEILRQTPLWPALGNHDGRTADSVAQTGPYYDIFSLPTDGQVGGVPSGTEAYYSFDCANAHFIVLDSHQADRSVDGEMLTWLVKDLAANDKDWIIAYWHHPPYTKGKHDSDREKRLIDMRKNALPILESYGVDLVLAGHSHSYERSYFIDGHYGRSDSFSASNLIDGGDGRPAGDGAYVKSAGENIPKRGSVYAVVGSSGKISGGSLDHEAMYISLNQLGSMIVDITGSRLEANFLNSAGDVSDFFSIEKSSQ